MKWNINNNNDKLEDAMYALRCKSKRLMYNILLKHFITGLQEIIVCNSFLFVFSEYPDCN